MVQSNYIYSAVLKSTLWYLYSSFLCYFKSRVYFQYSRSIQFFYISYISGSPGSPALHPEEILDFNSSLFIDQLTYCQAADQRFYIENMWSITAPSISL